MRPHLLIVQDNGSETAATLDSLRDWMDGAFTVEAVRRCDNAVARLVTPDPGRRAAIGPVVAILADLALPDSSGAQTFQRLHAAAPQVPIVLLCAPANEAVARAMMSHGAQDYLVKTRIDSYALPKALTGAIERAHVADAAAARGAAANATLQAIGDAVVATDVEGRVIYLNSAAEQLTGWTRAAATGQPVDHVFRIVDAETRRPARSPLEHAIRSDSIGRLASDCVLIRRDGSEAAVEDSAAPIHDRNGRVTGGVMVFHDVSAARSRSRYLAHLAQHDRLTGLCNRGLMRDRLTQAMSLAGRHEHGVAVLFLDVDGFKGVNDTLGHAVGDRLLQSVAQRLRACLRRSDTVSREGGDEFVILLTEVAQRRDAGCSAEKLRAALALAHRIDGRDLHVTASIGIATWPENGADAETLIKQADEAMYLAKKRGRNNCQFATGRAASSGAALRVIRG